MAGGVGWASAHPQLSQRLQTGEQPRQAGVLPPQASPSRDSPAPEKIGSRGLWRGTESAHQGSQTCLQVMLMVAQT